MNYTMRMIASLRWHQASACHLAFQIALIPACADPHHLVHCKTPFLQCCKPFWAAPLEGEPFCSQGHPHFHITVLQKDWLARSDLFLHLSTARYAQCFSLSNTDPSNTLILATSNDFSYSFCLLITDTVLLDVIHSEHTHNQHTQPCMNPPTNNPTLL